MLFRFSTSESICLALLAIAILPSVLADCAAPAGLECCQAVYSASDPTAAKILHSIGVTVSDPDEEVATQCTPIADGNVMEWCVPQADNVVNFHWPDCFPQSDISTLLPG